MSALEEELDDARHDLEAAAARQKLLTELLAKKPEAEEADDEHNTPREDENPRVGL